MASEVEISNRALQKLGAKRITSLTQDSVSARACLTCYATLRDAELQAHPWAFAIKQASLAADATAPDFGRDNAFSLPADYLGLLEPFEDVNTNRLDWIVQGRKIYTNQDAPLEFRYKAQVTDPNQMNVLFREALSSRMAVEMCEELTQSNTKAGTLGNMYKEVLREARRVNAIERIYFDPPEDFWLTVRL